MNVIRTEQLTDSIDVTLYDCTKQVAGDRFLVAMEARVDVPLPDDDTPAMALMRQIFGDKVTYIYRAERNFIDEQEKKSILTDQEKSFLINVLPYLKRDDVAGYIIKSKMFELKKEFWKHDLTKEDVSCLG